LQDELSQKKFELITVIDTLKYIEHMDQLLSLEPKYFLVKEVCNTSFMRWHQEKSEKGIQLRSPTEVCRLFKGYVPIRIWPSKYVLTFERPGPTVLRLVNTLSPTYTLILKKKGAK
jgi:hypothetical protein